MEINAQFDRTVAIKTDKLEWQQSPMQGVERRMLDRIGDEVARATSIVRYAPGSHFSAHTHTGGEEFIVLDGVFQDDYGDFPAGTYVRNPIGTRHIPRSDNGCTIFVKLWQFEPDDQRQFSVDLNSVALTAVDGMDGVARAILHDVAYESVVFESLDAGVLRPFEEPAGAEILLISGSIEWEGRSFARNDWLRFPPGYRGAVTAGGEGARIWLKTGHLAQISTPDA